MVDEKKVASASFIINFFRDLDQLTYFYSEYRTLLIRYNSKFKSLEKKDEKSVADLLRVEDKDQYGHIIKNLRFFMNKIDIKIQSLKNSVFNKQTDLVEETNKLYFTFDDVEVFRDADLRQYIINVNSLFADEIMGNLLQNSTDYINNLYNETEEQ